MALKDFFKKLRKKSQKSAQQAYSKKKAAEAKTPKRAASSNYDRVRQKAQPKITKPSGSSGGSSYRSGGSSQSSWGSRQTGGTTQHRSGSQGSKSRPQATKKANQTSWQSYVQKTLKSQKSASQKSALNAYEMMAGNRTNALGTKSKVRTGGGVRSRDLSSEDYLKMNNAIRMGLHTTGDKKLDKRIGSRTAYSANRNTASRISTGFMQGLAPADVLEGGVGTYSKKARKAVDEAKKSTSFNIGYGAGQMAGFALGGTSGAAKSLVQGGAKAAAKAGAKSAGKKFAKNRAAEVAVETPMNIADAVKMARDEDGKVNKKKLAGYMALNTGLTAGAGAVMEGAAVKFTKKNADELIKLQAKANKGSITKEEGQKLTKLYDKLDKARKDTTAAKSNAAEEAYTKGRNMVSDARIERGKAKGAQRAENARQARIEAQNAKVERAVEQAKESTQQAKNARINARVGSYVDEVNARNAQTLNDRDLVYRNRESINEGTFTDARGNTAPDVENIPTGKKANQNTAKSARKSTRETLSSKTENPRAYSKAETKEINDTVDRISNMLAHGDAADARAEAKALARKHGQVDKTFKTALDGADEYASALDKAKRAIYSRPWYMPDGAAKTLDEFYEVIGGRKNVGGYIHLRKNYRGNKDISSVDDVAKEFMDEYPELFPRDIVHSDGTVDEVKFFKSLGDIVQTKGDDIPRFREEDIPEDALEKIYDDLADDILKNAERNTDAMKDISSKDIQKRVRELSKVRQKYLEDMKAVMDDKSLSAAERFKKIDELNKDIAPTEEELFSLEGQLDDVLKREQKAKSSAPKVDERPVSNEPRTGGPESLDSIMGRVKDNLTDETDKYVTAAEERMQKARNAKINKDVDESLRKLRERPGNFQEEPPKKEPARGDMPDLKGMSEKELADDVKKYTKYLRNTENKYGADSPRAIEMREHLEEAKTRLDDIRHEKKTGQRTTRSDDPPAKQKGAEMTLDEPRTRFGKAWRSFYRVMVDSEADIERFAKKIGGETGQNLLAGANAFRNARNIAGSWIQTATSTFNREQSGKCLDDIFKGLKGNKRADAIRYSYLVHNLDRTLPKKDADELIKLQGMVKNGDELTEEQAKRLETLKNKDKPIAGMPRTREETEQAIKELKGKYAPSEVKVFENFQQDVVKYADELLQYKVDAGVVSEAEAKRLRGAYKNYIPTFTNKEFSGVVHEAQNTGVSVSRGVKAAKGAGIEDELVDLYEQLAQATRSTIKHCEMNELLRTLGEAQGVKYADIDKTLSPDELLGNSLFISKQTGSNKKAFYYTADGKQHTVDLTDEMYMGLREMTGEEKAVLLNNPIVRKMAMPMKLFKGLITDWNIFFGVRNGARDLATALTYTKDVRGYIKAYPKAIKALTTHNDYYKAYIAAGGQFSSLVKEGGVDRTLKLLEEGKYSPLKWASDINGFIEMMPRMQEFISTIDKAGVPPAKAGRKVIDRAMRNANDVTLNFGRSGIVGKSLNVGAVPYLNPSIQGLDKIGRVFSEAKNEKNIRGLIGLGAKMSTFAIAPSVFNEWMLRNDEDYQQLNTRDKDNNYYIPLGVLTEKLGVKSDDDKGKFIKIPKARELVVAAEPFQYFYRHAQFGDSGGWKQMFKTGIDNVGVVNPLNENFISPVFRMANNKTWYGGNIESAYEVENLPTEDRYDESTSAIGIKLGQTKIAKELKLSPKKIDNLIDSYTGVIGDYMIPATAQASKGNPILNQFITDSVFSNKLSTETWEKYDELSQKANSKSLSGADRQKAAYAKQDMYDKYINDAMILTRAVADVQGDKKLTKKEKGKYARDLRKYQNEIYRAANEGGEPTMNGKEVDPLKSIYKTFVTSEGTKAVDRAFKYSGKQYQEAYGEYKNILKGSTSSKESKAHDRKRFLDYCVDIRETQGKIGGSKDYVSYKTAAVVAAINKVSNKKQDAFGIYDDTRETAKTYSKVYDIDHYTHTEKTSFDASRKIGLEKQSEMQSHDIAMAQAQKKNDDGSYFIGDSRPEYQKGRMPAARYLVKTNKKQWTTKEIHDFADKYDFDYKSDYDTVYEQAKKTYKNYTDIECAAVAQVITNKGYNDFGDTSMEGDSGIMGGVYSGSGYGGRGRRRYGRRGYRRRGYGGGGGYGGSPSMDWNTYVGNIFTSQPEKPKAQAKEKVHDYTKKSELTEAYRRRAQNKQTIKNKKA